MVMQGRTVFIALTLFVQVAAFEQDLCSLNAIKGDTCGQSDLDCKYVKFAKLAEKSLTDGTCASQGYTVKGSTETSHYPIVGDITITKYTKPAMLMVQQSCSVYEIKGDTCGQSDILCDYVKFVKTQEKSLKDGTCASQGYTVKGSTETKHYPFVGDITITKYTKPAMLMVQKSCSIYEIKGGTCGQSDIDCQYVHFVKTAEKSVKDGTCAGLGYTVKVSTETLSYPKVGDITITKYAKPEALIFTV